MFITIDDHNSGRLHPSTSRRLAPTAPASSNSLPSSPCRAQSASPSHRLLSPPLSFFSWCHYRRGARPRNPPPCNTVIIWRDPPYPRLRNMCPTPYVFAQAIIPPFAIFYFFACSFCLCYFLRFFQLCIEVPWLEFVGWLVGLGPYAGVK